MGLGNDLLTDDSIGLRVAAAAEELLGPQQNLTIGQTTEMGLSLLDRIVGFEELILVDAVQTGQQPPGFVHEIASEDLEKLPAVSPHFLGVGEMLALGRKLGLAVPKRIKILAIEVQDALTVGTRLTPALQAAFPTIVERVLSAARAAD